MLHISSSLRGNIQERWTIFLNFVKSTIKGFLRVFQDKNYTTYVGDNISFDDQRSPLQNNAEFKRALTVHEIQNDVTIYKIHRYFFNFVSRNVTGSFRQ